ncbi:MAG: PorT family protein [Tannerellaceae bacterium]|jgi:hypothetical protein|nr:PorT family protein [Tannerellaceae bacterium]
MKKSLLIAITAIAFCLPAVSQQESGRKWEYRMFAGHNAGGSMPLPLPAEIRKIRYWSPEPFTGSLAFHVTRFISPKWGVTSGLAIDVKGMKTEADVKYMNTSLVVGEGDHQGVFQGMFTGRNKLRIRNGYLVLPLLGTYAPSRVWRFHAGGYVAFLQDARFEGNASDGYIRQGGPAGDRINIEESTFDFSDNVRKTDAGVMALADWFFTKKLAVTGQLSWGLVSLFPGDFNGIPYKMYNIYLMGGIAYRL